MSQAFQPKSLDWCGDSLGGHLTSFVFAQLLVADQPLIELKKCTVNSVPCSRNVGHFSEVFTRLRLVSDGLSSSRCVGLKPGGVKWDRGQQTSKRSFW